MAMQKLVCDLKAAVDAYHLYALQEPTTDCPFIEEKLEDLAENAVQCAQKVDISFERAKIRHPLSPTDVMKADIKEMEASLVEKEALLQKSLIQVMEWDSMLTAFREAQPAILIPPKSSS